MFSSTANSNVCELDNRLLILGSMVDIYNGIHTLYMYFLHIAVAQFYKELFKSVYHYVQVVLGECVEGEGGSCKAPPPHPLWTVPI